MPRGRTVKPLIESGGVSYALPATPRPGAAFDARQRARFHADGLIEALCDLWAAQAPVVPSPAPPPAWYSVAEAAALLRVDPATVSAWVRQGRLPAWQVGRVTRIQGTDLERLGGRGAVAEAE